MGFDVFFAHFISLQPLGFGPCRGVHDARGEHARAHDGPFACGGVPDQTVALEPVADVENVVRVDHQRRIVRCGLVAPHVFVPVGQRGLVHLGQRFFGVAFHDGERRELGFTQSEAGRGIGEHEPETGRSGRRDRNHYRSIGVETYVQRGIEACYRKFGQRAEHAVLFGFDPCRAVHRSFGDVEFQTAQCKRPFGRELQRDFAAS